MSDENQTSHDTVESPCDCCSPPAPDEESGDATRNDPPRDSPSVGTAAGTTEGEIHPDSAARKHGAALLQNELPPDIQTQLGRLLGRQRVATVEEFVTSVRQVTGGGSIAVEDLCLTDGETPHWGTLDGERYYFRCFYDAVILAGIAEQPVDVHTMSPGGEVIEARAVGSEQLSVSPPAAVASFGVAENIEPPEGDNPSLPALYDAICPYVKAFPDREAYDRWAADVPARTLVAPFAGLTGIAAMMAGELPGYTGRRNP